MGTQVIPNKKVFQYECHFLILVLYYFIFTAQVVAVDPDLRKQELEDGPGHGGW